MARFIACLRAHLGGYFWLPCPNCGKMFGGHEASGSLYDSWVSGQSTCNDPKCLAEVERKNKAFFAANPPPAINDPL